MWLGHWTAQVFNVITVSDEKEGFQHASRSNLLSWELNLPQP